MTTYHPSGDVAADTATLHAAAVNAMATGEAAVLCGDWTVLPVSVDAPAAFDDCVLDGNATLQLADLDTSADWQDLFRFELGASQGNRIRFGSGLTFKGGGQSQTLGPQSALVRVTRNPNVAQGNGNLTRFEFDAAIDTPNSIGLAFGAIGNNPNHPPFQWIDEAALTGVQVAGARGAGVGRAHVEIGAGVKTVEVTGLQGDADTFIQTEWEVDGFSQTLVVRDCTWGEAQFAGDDHATGLEATLLNCVSLTHLALSKGTYAVRNGYHKLAGQANWYRSSLDVSDAHLLMDAHGFLNIYHKTGQAADVELVRAFVRNVFAYSNPSDVGASTSPMLKFAPSQAPDKHLNVTVGNNFDPACYCSIEARGIGIVSDRDRVAGQYGIQLGAWSTYGGDVHVTAYGDDHCRVRGSSVKISGSAATAPLRGTFSGDGFRGPLDAGNLSHARMASSQVFNRDTAPAGGGIKGAIWHYNGRTWEAMRTHNTDADWAEVA